MKFIRSKFLLILLAMAILLFFTNDFGLVDIERTAIIVALGIDYDEENSLYTLTSQIAIPQTSNTTVQNDDTLISGTGTTIADALDDIGLRTGWYPMLAFCNIILLGNTAISGDVMSLLNYFVRSDMIQDSALIACCDGNAKDFLSSKSPLDSISSFALQKILSKDIAKLDRVANTNVKDFAIGYYSKSEASYMPLLKRIKVEEKSKSQQSDENPNATGGKSEEGKDDEKYIFDATNTLIFKKGQKVAVLNDIETLLFNLEHKNSIDTYLSIDNAKTDGKITEVMLDLNEHRKNYSLTIENGKPVFNVELTMFCRFEDINMQKEIDDLTPASKIPDDILRQAEEKMENALKSLFIKLQYSDCDLFLLKEKLYRFHYFEYENLKDSVLKDATLKTKIKCYTELSTRA